MVSQTCLRINLICSNLKPTELSEEEERQIAYQQSRKTAFPTDRGIKTYKNLTYRYIPDLKWICIQ